LKLDHEGIMINIWIMIINDFIIIELDGMKLEWSTDDKNRYSNIIYKKK